MKNKSNPETRKKTKLENVRFSTDGPLAEKDEVKQAELRTANAQKNAGAIEIKTLSDKRIK